MFIYGKALPEDGGVLFLIVWLITEEYSFKVTHLDK